jgi:Zn-dependent alcohol dehydrogenase
MAYPRHTEPIRKTLTTGTDDVGKVTLMMVDLYMSGLVPFDRMITKYKFNQINEAIEDQKQGKVVKVVFTFD